MTSAQVVEILRDALMAAFWMALPMLAVGFVAGIVMSLVQVLTSIQDTAFGTVPRLLVSLVSMLALLPWMVHRSMSYTIDLIHSLSQYGH
ncbi:MAG: flagellar biosynthetic protein FliQ [Acidobacteriota bacterium]